MYRTKQTTIAAILQFLFYASTVVLTYPDLATGATPQAGGPSGYIVTVLAFTISVLGIVAAYGTWTDMKWGKVLALIVNVVFAFLCLGALIFASPIVKIVAGALVFVNALIIVLLLWSTSKPATA